MLQFFNVFTPADCSAGPFLAEGREGREGGRGGGEGGRGERGRGRGKGWGERGKGGGPFKNPPGGALNRQDIA